MNSEAILAIILAVLGVLGGGGIWTYLQSRKDAPVRKRDADLAVADKSQQMAMAIADDLRQDYARLRLDLDEEKGARQELTGRVDALARQVRDQDRTITSLREVVRAFSSAWDDLAASWHVLRLQDKPPPKPKTHNP